MYIYIYIYIINIYEIHEFFLSSCLSTQFFSTINILIFFLVPSGPPLSVYIVQTTNTSLLLSWEAPALEHQNGVILKYHITFNNNTLEKLDATNTSIALLNLHPFYTYELLVAAESSAGVGPRSKSVFYTMPQTSRSLREDCLQSLQVNKHALIQIYIYKHTHK